MRNSAGTTALHTAAKNGKVDALTALLEAGADIAARNDDGDTAREAAARRENGETQDTLTHSHLRVSTPTGGDS